MDVVEEAACKVPHQLFMLNKDGQTPLDICIEADSLNNVELTQEHDTPLSFRNDGANFGSKYGRGRTTKIIDESQTKELYKKGKDGGESAEDRVAAEAKYDLWMRKTFMLMRLM